MRLIKVLVILLVVSLAGLLSFEQAVSQKYSVSDESEMTIYGSANVTDWEAEVKSINGEVIIRNEMDDEWTDVDASWFERVKITIPVKDIDSDSGRMNNNMHKYLKASDYPEILYEMKESKELVLSNNPGAILTVRGVLTVAGNPHEIVHDVKISNIGDKKLTITGEQELKMTDFGIDPPTALLGSIRAHDEITVEFKLVLE